jgi:hypothetical protein
MHPGQVLEDLFLHGQERRLVKAQVTRGVSGKPPRRPPEHRAHRPAHGVRDQSHILEPGVKSRADHARQAGPLQVGVVKEQPPVIAVDGLHRPPVLLDPAPRAPAPAVNTRAVKRPAQPHLLQLMRLYAHDATTQPRRRRLQERRTERRPASAACAAGSAQIAPSSTPQAVSAKEAAAAQTWPHRALPQYGGRITDRDRLKGRRSAGSMLLCSVKGSNSIFLGSFLEWL